MPETLHEFLDRLSSSAPAPGGLTAVALGAAMGVALLEKALRFPPAGTEGSAQTALGVLGPLRSRLSRLVESDQPVLEALAAAGQAPDDEREQKLLGARMGSYRSARRLLDAVIQGWTFFPTALDFGSTAMLADIEAAFRLLAAAQASAIAQAEDTLKLFPEDLAASERNGLARQVRQADELAEKAQGGLQWRRGKA